MKGRRHVDASGQTQGDADHEISPDEAVQRLSLLGAAEDNQPERRKSGRGGKRVGAGRKPNATKQYHVAAFFTRKDAKEAAKTIMEHVKTKQDRMAAQYVIDQLCGTAVQKRVQVTDTRETKVVRIELPPKFSELAKLALAVDAPVKVLTTKQGGEGVVEVGERSVTPGEDVEAAKARAIELGRERSRRRRPGALSAGVGGGGRGLGPSLPGTLSTPTGNMKAGKSAQDEGKVVDTHAKESKKAAQA